MGTCSYIPIVEAAVEVVVMEIEAIVVAMSITTNKIGKIGLAMGIDAAKVLQEQSCCKSD